jgi:ABC-type proline/glycine betaine transport system permease subunit
LEIGTFGQVYLGNHRGKRKSADIHLNPKFSVIICTAATPNNPDRNLDTFLTKITSASHMSNQFYKQYNDITINLHRLLTSLAKFRNKQHFLIFYWLAYMSTSNFAIINFQNHTSCPKCKRTIWNLTMLASNLTLISSSVCTVYSLLTGVFSYKTWETVWCFERISDYPLYSILRYLMKEVELTVYIFLQLT